jgi:hypothetical protein
MKAFVFRSVVGRRCVVEPGAMVMNVKVPNDRYVPAGAVLKDLHDADALPRITPSYPLKDLNAKVVKVNTSLAAGYNRSGPAHLAIPLPHLSPRSRLNHISLKNGTAIALTKLGSCRIFCIEKSFIMEQQRYGKLRRLILAIMILVPSVPFIIVLAIGYYYFHHVPGKQRHRQPEAHRGRPPPDDRVFSPGAQSGLGIRDQFLPL